MNITSYVEQQSKAKLFHGKISIKFDYSIVNADETMYKFLGANSGRPFTAMIHEEDLASFYDCVDKLDEGTQHLIMRFVSEDGIYRLIYVIMDKSNKSIDMELVDIANNHKKFDSLRDTSFKCKKFMNYSNNIYFEYFIESRTINIFEYLNERSINHFNRNIDELYEEVNSSNRFTLKQKHSFAALYEGLVEHVDNFAVSVDGCIFGFEKCTLDIKGGIVYKYGKKYLFAAVVNKVVNEDALGEEKYYKTSYGIEAATGVYNKRAISELAIDILASAAGKRCYVIMLDIDDFKEVNDNFGHMIGDDVIAKVAEVVKRYVGERGYVGRFGGDEFFVITDKLADEEALVYMLKTIKKNLAWECTDIAPGFNMTLSIGVSCYPENGTNYDELLMIADKCLYLAKSKGKNRHIIFRDALHGEIDTIKSNKKLTLNSLFEDNYHMCSVAMSVMNDIRDENVSIQYSIARVSQEFAIEAIAVYKGPEFERVESTENYASPIAKAKFFNDDECDQLIDANGLYCINKLVGIKEKWPNAYEQLERQGNLGVFIIKQGDIAVSYDLFSRIRKWSDLDKGLLLMIGKAIIKRLSN